ncbi:MAG TPA: hypothetical protein ENJ37_01170 [Deltaproteobacteria bacterium]|nr:hypothetical protein [Deltaproteobacteria bacterium]
MKRLWEKWKVLAVKIGEFNSRVILTVFYFVIMLPFGVGARLFSDPLSMKRKRNASYWVDREAAAPTLQDAKRQF